MTSELKRGLGIDVLTAARQRIATVFDHFPKICVSFSGGKDSSVLLHLVMEECERRDRRVGVLFIDLEGQYRLTIEHVEECFRLFRDHIEPFWVALPIILRNAVSMYEPRWICWDPSREKDWVRKPSKLSITDPNYFPFFRHAMEFEEFVPAFGHWYADGEPCACLVGIRSDESLNRWRAIAASGITRLNGLQWTSWHLGSLFNAYPIYDWRTRDIWIYNARFRKPYNRLYDRMHQAGLSIHQQRICQPYGDDQRRGLWLFHVIEPQTWAKIVARVNGANSGALYCGQSGNIQGMLKITKPADHTWQSFASLLLESLPTRLREHYQNKIAVFINWWLTHGGAKDIPDEADPKDEAMKKCPSWRRICKALLRNDYWCKGLSFNQTNSGSYQKYLKLMRKRRSKWRMYEVSDYSALESSNARDN